MCPRYTLLRFRAMHDHAGFVREHTVLAAVPLVPEVRIHTATEVLPIWRATSAWLDAHDLGVPFWCVPWAGGQALARWVLDRPEVVRGKRVLDFGTGSGLVAIAAALAGAASVRAVDVDAFAIAACRINAAANGVTIHAQCMDLVGAAVEEDLLLAGDVWYEAGPARRFAAWFEALPVAVVTGDPGRHYVPAAARELARYEVPTTLELESATTRTTRVLALGGRAV
ncbi:MAG: methyltransferase [Labilithrix sp.]|nr:methyltransferase [Labilithrix sp.]MCW5813032.1 methyltransferase [Labilithrix sp.]